MSAKLGDRRRWFSTDYLRLPRSLWFGVAPPHGYLQRLLSITFVPGTQFLRTDGTAVPDGLLATPEGKPGLKADYNEGLRRGLPIPGENPTPILEKGHKVPLEISYGSRNGKAHAELIWTKANNGPSPEAIAAAKSADAIIAVVGITSQLEGEEMPVSEPGFVGGDRTSIDLPQPEEELVEAVAASGKPLAVVLLNGTLEVAAEPGGVKVSINLDKPLPQKLAWRAGFNLEFLPSIYMGKAYLVDGNKAGIFPPNA